MAKALPDQSLLNEILRYEPDTGRLFWRERGEHLFAECVRKRQGTISAAGIANHWNSRFAGTEAFTAKSHSGYRRGLIFGEQFKAHRIIFKMVFGYDPDCVDHINRIRDDNRICNLRSVSHAENCSHFLGRPEFMIPGPKPRKTKAAQS